jgi:hypothetical protein
MKEMTQTERLDYLVEEFKEDSVRYRDLETPKDTEGKKRVLRSLMNIRMPRRMDARVTEVQDEYLKECIRENGIVTLSEIPTLADDNAKTEAYHEILNIMVEDSASCYIQDPTTLTAVSTRLTGYSVYPMYVQDMSQVKLAE